MKTGTLISGAGHAVFIALAAFGLPWLDPAERDAIRVTNVRFVTEAEFEAARAGVESEADVPAAPETTEPALAPEPVPAPVPEPETTAPQQQAPASEPDLELSALTPGADPDAPLRAPDGTLENTLPTVFAPRLPDRVTAPRARPAPRIIEVPTPQPAEQDRAAVVEEVEVAPAPVQAEAPRDPVPAPEAAPETEPAESNERIDLALSASPPPRARPERRPVAGSAPTADAPPQADLQATIESLVAGATVLTPATPPAQSAPALAIGAEGPPLSAGEKDGLRLAVQRCWIVPAGLRDAQELRVVLAAELTAQGEVISSSVRLIEPDPMPDERFRQAYEAGRRALIRCSPYSDLPREKYAQWRSIEVVFNPEGMVSW